MLQGVHCSISCGYRKNYINTLRVHIDAFQMSRFGCTCVNNGNLYYLSVITALELGCAETCIHGYVAGETPVFPLIFSIS